LGASGADLVFTADTAALSMKTGCGDGAIGHNGPDATHAV
jgi:hypothetical protein